MQFASIPHFYPRSGWAAIGTGIDDAICVIRVMIWFNGRQLKFLIWRPSQEGAHEHIAEARHFFGSNPGGTTLKCENWNFSWKVEITGACMGMIRFIENFFKNHPGPRSKLSKLLMDRMKRRSSSRNFEFGPHWAELTVLYCAILGGAHCTTKKPP